MDKTIFMSEFDVALPGDILRTTLGSCIGIILEDSRTQAIGMAHIMLPRIEGFSDKSPGKYADTAIPALLKILRVTPQEALKRLRAKIAGGANMFPKVSVPDAAVLIGNQNITAVREVLGQLKIPIVSEDLGGTRGRQLIADAGRQKIFVSAIGESPREL